MEGICLPERREVAQVAQHGLQQKIADVATVHKIVQIVEDDINGGVGSLDELDDYSPLGRGNVIVEKHSVVQHVDHGNQLHLLGFHLAVNASVDEHLVRGINRAEQIVESDHRGIGQGELVLLRQTRTGLVLVEQIVLLGVVSHRVAAVTPGDVELHVVLIVSIGAHLHELGARALQGLGHVLHLEVVQIVLDLHMLSAVSIHVVLPCRVLRGAGRVNHHLLHNLVIRQSVQHHGSDDGDEQTGHHRSKHPAVQRMLSILELAKRDTLAASGF
mmetsp:Transcript_62226/g.109628  ORF Transcript_62226/g.109628 Transcript_62226/m.109628 type:complete len:273 (-) Transcript_62226:217-1035(-)